MFRIEGFDPIFEKLVAEGKAERFGFEESREVGWQRGGARVLVHARAKHRVVDANRDSMIETTPVPPECFPRSLAAPSLLAHILTEKFCDGLPLHRIENRLAREGFALDRGTMSRWVEDARATAGATVIEAARDEAWRTAFCIATDATGIPVKSVASALCVRPTRSDACWDPVGAPLDDDCAACAESRRARALHRSRECRSSRKREAPWARSVVRTSRSFPDSTSPGLRELRERRGRAHRSSVEQHRGVLRPAGAAAKPRSSRPRSDRPTDRPASGALGVLAARLAEIAADLHVSDQLSAERPLPRTPDTVEEGDP